MSSIAHWAASSLALAALAAHAASPLPALNVDKTQISVSGLSSGAFMANQLGYAYSSTFMGVGVFAGGPYMCAGHNNYTACMYNASISASQLSTMQADLTNWSGTNDDALSNVARQKVFLWVGSSDTTVGPNPMTGVKTQYTNNGVTAANLSWNQQSGANHTFPTDFAGSGDNACGTAASPYISNCSFDGAGAMLKQFYGTLNARNNAPASANYIQFDQTPYTAGNAGMAATGWIYVPASCASGTSCRLHVALHGCLQNYAQIGVDFIQNTGYTRWADTNNIIVLFPQTQVDNGTHSTAAAAARRDGVDHRLDRLHLHAGLLREGRAVPADPVPAAVGVGQAAAGGGRVRAVVHLGLREQHDDVVGVGPARVARVLDEVRTDLRIVLQAAVQRHVQAAEGAAGA